MKMKQTKEKEFKKRPGKQKGKCWGSSEEGWAALPITEQGCPDRLDPAVSKYLESCCSSGISSGKHPALRARLKMDERCYLTKRMPFNIVNWIVFVHVQAVVHFGLAFLLVD